MPGAGCHGLECLEATPLTQVAFPKGDVGRLHFVEVPAEYAVSLPRTFGLQEKVEDGTRRYDTQYAASGDDKQWKVVVVVERAEVE